MKSTFFGFYSINEDTLSNIWKSESTLFVFDTNCLLNLYRCEDQTRDDILNVMKEVASRSWLPFQVGFEYQRNRRTVIEESVSSLIKIQSELKDIYIQNILAACKIKKHLYNSLSDEITNLQAEIKSPIDTYIENKISPRIASKKAIAEHDSIRGSIDLIFLDRVGAPPSQERVNEINNIGIDRYQKKQPPGFEDEKKKSISYFYGVEFQDKYGDLYLWKEIIEKASSEEIKNVIFVCDDQKEDWYFELSGKTHGVLESLKTEICKEAKIDNFKLINQLTFLHEAKKYLDNINISDSSLKEVEELTHVVDNEYKNIERLNHNHRPPSGWAGKYIREYMKNYINVRGNNIELFPVELSKVELEILQDSKLNLENSLYLTEKSQEVIKTAKHHGLKLKRLLGDPAFDIMILKLEEDIKILKAISQKVEYLISQVEIISGDSISSLDAMNKNLASFSKDVDSKTEILLNLMKGL